MKKIIGISLIAVCMSMAHTGEAQTVKKVEHKVGHAAKKTGQKTAELASKGKSKVWDKTYKDKVGPNGETIYIDKHSKYYWVDKKGHKQYVEETELKDKY